MKERKKERTRESKHDSIIVSNVHNAGQLIASWENHETEWKNKSNRNEGQHSKNISSFISLSLTFRAILTAATVCFYRAIFILICYLRVCVCTRRRDMEFLSSILQNNKPKPTRGSFRFDISLSIAKQNNFQSNDQSFTCNYACYGLVIGIFNKHIIYFEIWSFRSFEISIIRQWFVIPLKTVLERIEFKFSKERKETLSCVTKFLRKTEDRSLWPLWR